MRVLHLDSNHPLLIEQLQAKGFQNDEDYHSSKEEIEKIIANYDGIVLRSRFRIDAEFLSKAKKLKFIARVGAGLENIDIAFAKQKGIQTIAAPEGNRTAVAEHALGMLLCLMNKLLWIDQEVRKGIWIRESNRGFEIENKTVGIIGYGNMGKAFAQRLKGFGCKVLCYDILPNVGDENATQVSLETLQKETDILSLHTPQTPETEYLINQQFINAFAKNIWFINTARGKSVKTNDLVEAIKEGRIIGAALDVLEYEKSSFEQFFTDQQLPDAFQYLIHSDKVLLSPHVAGWTIESKEKLAQVIVDKIVDIFVPQANSVQNFVKKKA